MISSTMKKLLWNMKTKMMTLLCFWTIDHIVLLSFIDVDDAHLWHPWILAGWKQFLKKKAKSNNSCLETMFSFIIPILAFTSFYSIFFLHLLLSSSNTIILSFFYFFLLYIFYIPHVNDWSYCIFTILLLLLLNLFLSLFMSLWHLTPILFNTYLSFSCVYLFWGSRYTGKCFPFF